VTRILMDTKKLLSFLISARSHTYAGNTGEVSPVFAGHKQYEYTDGAWLYRDMYVVGNGRFVGCETIHQEAKPVWSMSYYGNFSAMTEEGADKILRQAMIANVEKTRLWYSVEWNDGKFVYQCEGAGSDIVEIRGTEVITCSNIRLYTFIYAGGLVG